MVGDIPTPLKIEFVSWEYDSQYIYIYYIYTTYYHLLLHNLRSGIHRSGHRATDTQQCLTNRQVLRVAQRESSRRVDHDRTSRDGYPLVN